MGKRDDGNSSNGLHHDEPRRKATHGHKTSRTGSAEKEKPVKPSHPIILNIKVDATEERFLLPDPPNGIFFDMEVKHLKTKAAFFGF